MPATATLAAPQSQPEWFASWFDSPHYHRLYAHRDESEAVAFVDRLIRQLEPRDGAAVLDLGCGSGRHSRCLAARGFRVTAIDLSAESLARARRRPGPVRPLRRTGHAAPLRHANVRLRAEPVHQLRVFRGPDGSPDGDSQHRGVVEIRRNRRARLPECRSRSEASRRRRDHRTRRRWLHLSRWSDDRAFFKRISIVEGPGRPTVEHVERVAKLTLEDFQRMFGLCGLRIEDAYGDYELRRFDAATSPRLILVAAKIDDRADTLPAREILADAAQRFGRHPEIGREHRLGNAHHDRRIHPEKLEIALLGGGAERADDPLILRGGMPLQPGPEGGGVPGTASTRC